MKEIKGEKYRLSVITDRLIRLEYQEDGIFEDSPTQMVLNRNFSENGCEIKHKDDRLILETRDLILSYDEEPFSSTGLSITLKQTGSTWHYGIVFGNSDENLSGTARTLDQTDGFVEMDRGIFGLKGYAVIDDSRSPVFVKEGFKVRKVQETDLYFFGYGRDFYGGLRDFFSLCGKVPMIPRYALGNWWSRYFRYTERSYLELLDRFEEEKIPLSVAVIDMDWHLTEVDEKYGTGWTGYTWNRECFPDYKRFLAELKKRKLAATLNLHPADGIRGFEDMYPAAARRIGIDPESEKCIEHDLYDPGYREAYFEEIMHPYEDDGVDFWWIDWQQGTGRKDGEVDPLLLLNHYHYEDSKRGGKRPLIFSRYAGPGSHRYPLGFSGDTFTTWRSLAFQPFFTATASNIGYGWWSHDIGGHMLGDKDNERLIRWIQFGVFSPVMRIHSSNSPFFNKEPWTLEEPWHGIMAEMLRLRHRLVPYLYTEAYRAHKDDLPMVQPLYYRYPDAESSYSLKNEYLFGSSLLVCAITEPEDRVLKLAAVNAYIPEGRWYDIFTGRIYESRGIVRKLYRPLESIPVLLPAGGILPLSMQDTSNGTDNPGELCVMIGYGGDGTYTLYEDDGISMAFEKESFCTTGILVKRDRDKGSCTVTIEAAEGDLSLIPEERTFEIVLLGAAMTDDAEVSSSIGSPELCRGKIKNSLAVKGLKAKAGQELKIMISGIGPAENDRKAQVFEILDKAWTETTVKERVFDALCSAVDDEEFLSALSEMDISEVLKDAVREVFL